MESAGSNYGSVEEKKNTPKKTRNVHVIYSSQCFTSIILNSFKHSSSFLRWVINCLIVVSVMKRSEFEFPATDYSSAVPNDVVLFGKVITRRTEPGPDKRENRVLTKSESSSGRSNGFMSWLRSPSGKEIRCRRSESGRSRYKTVLKFPLQMELSDIKKRQDRREPLPPPPLPRIPAKDDGDGGESCWELVRPLRRQGTLKNAFFGCFLPIV